MQLQPREVTNNSHCTEYKPIIGQRDDDDDEINYGDDEKVDKKVIRANEMRFFDSELFKRFKFKMSEFAYEIKLLEGQSGRDAELPNESYRKKRVGLGWDAIEGYREECTSRCSFLIRTVSREIE